MGVQVRVGARFSFDGPGRAGRLFLIRDRPRRISQGIETYTPG